MNKISAVSFILAVMFLCSGAQAYIMTFDDIAAGSSPINPYGAGFSGFSIADHSNSSWGHPHSGGNVLVANGYTTNGMLKFNEPAKLDESYYVHSLGAYFSTESGVVIQIVGYHDTFDQAIGSVLIGSSDGAWNNEYAGIYDPLGRINAFMFYPVSSSDAFSHWCADDMTIVPVPEPSTLVALLCGLGIFGTLIRRRKE